jgi:hypothetical protein
METGRRILYLDSEEMKQRKGGHTHHNSGHYPSSWLLFKTQRNSIGSFVPHRKHIMSPLRAQQVNAIYRFVTSHNSGHYLSTYGAAGIHSVVFNL